MSQETSRDADMKMVDYFREKYGPFETKVVKNTRKHQCDFCGNQSAKKVVRTHSKAADKDLFVCFACDALMPLLGEKQCAEVHMAALTVDMGLCESSDPTFQDAINEAQRVQEALAPEAPKGDELKAIVEEAARNMSNGKGGSWKIIPDLLRQYKERRSLSPKQTACLVKFNKSCK